VVDFLSLSGFLSYILACKLKALKVDLRVWNEEVFGNVERKKKLLFWRIYGFLRVWKKGEFK
jgi:hypothetical protein